MATAGGGNNSVGGGYYVEPVNYTSIAYDFSGGGSGGCVSAGGYTTTTAGGFGPYITPGTVTISPSSSLFTTRTNQSHLEPSQIQFLLRNHRFIDMEQSTYCMYCYALDMFRTRADHDFMIREE